MENGTDWTVEARQLAAQCWCDEETQLIAMDVRLGEAFAKRLAAWMEIAAQHARNEDFYRDLLFECAKHLGPEVFVSDDGSIQDEPLLLKVPELIEKLVSR